MHFFTEIIAAILMAYLAFPNGLATKLANWIPPAFDGNQSELAESASGTVDQITSLPSRLGQSIPDILLRSAEYQQAAVSDATGQSKATTRNPLEALVNIYCTFSTREYVRTTTGTGFFVDSDGIIMTNAHVAQFLLMEDTEDTGHTECVIRSGNPASPQYRAKLLYLPPTWVQENAKVMKEEVPMGTGERDYALLYVSEGISGRPLPARFPSLAFDSSLLPISVKNDTVLASGYPATDLIENGPATDLVPEQATTSISELYTFGSNYADVFSVRGSAVGAEGSSGGPIVNEAGQVIGIIVTRGDDDTDGPGSLRAITISHIARTMEEETGFTLEENLGGNLPYRASIFAKTLSPFLLALLQNDSN